MWGFNTIHISCFCLTCKVLDSDNIHISQLTCQVRSFDNTHISCHTCEVRDFENTHISFFTCQMWGFGNTRILCLPCQVKDSDNTHIYVLPVRWEILTVLVSLVKLLQFLLTLRLRPGKTESKVRRCSSHVRKSICKCQIKLSVNRLKPKLIT